jgi:hypothetical protein
MEEFVPFTGELMPGTEKSEETSSLITQYQPIDGSLQRIYSCLLQYASTISGGVPDVEDDIGNGITPHSPYQFTIS